jgi:hypothetical protein
MDDIGEQPAQRMPAHEPRWSVGTPFFKNTVATVPPILKAGRYIFRYSRLLFETLLL